MGELAKRRSELARGLSLPGVLTPISWTLPKTLTFEQWCECGRTLDKIESGSAWWRGDWWNAGVPYGDRVEAIRTDDSDGISHGRYRNCGVIAKEFNVSRRRDTLEFKHHEIVAALSRQQQKKWLDLAERQEWSANQMKAAIAQRAALDRTSEIDLNAKTIGKYAVLYADPPWRYEHPPMGGGNRSIENHYPTMTLEEICALPVGDIAADDSVLYLWATSPKLVECMQVCSAWGFTPRTTAVWIKDKIGMGYYFREQHEILLVAKRGELPPPQPEARPSSVVEAPRLEHSAKPPVFCEILDRMYPGVRKIELFSRERAAREGWTNWGNQNGVGREEDRAA